MRSSVARPCDGFAEWASDRLPRGTHIANLAWSDFPLLFYSAPQYDYLAGLDPMFAYYASPRTMAALEAFRTGRLHLPPIAVFQLTGARYAFASKQAAALANALISQRFEVVYAGHDGWLFDLKPGDEPPVAPAGPARRSRLQ